MENMKEVEEIESVVVELSEDPKSVTVQDDYVVFKMWDGKAFGPALFGVCDTKPKIKGTVENMLGGAPEGILDTISPQVVLLKKGEKLLIMANSAPWMNDTDAFIAAMAASDLEIRIMEGAFAGATVAEPEA